MNPAVAAVLAAMLSAAPVAPRRLAVVVGSNSASPGRAALHFAHDDARALAEVLVRTGEFRPQDVAVLLDPKPGAVLEALDAGLKAAASSGAESLVLFYYSGHADAEALYPGGAALPLESLRQRLDSASATVRVGIVDACRGGGWTHAKGLQPAPAFEVRPPLTLKSEGSALLASSSGLESAHESESLRGSFFTHHLVAGLRGAADRSGDGEVSLGEAFAYAKELTIRDTSLQAEAPQHPSFDLNLRGRSDLPLSRVAASDSLLHLDQSQGPLQVIELSSGLIVAETQAGELGLKLAVPPGRYLVRRRDSGQTFAREVTVAANSTAQVREQNLELVGTSALAVKGSEPPAGTLTTVARGEIELKAMVGVTHPDPSGIENLPAHVLEPATQLGLSVGITDRLQYALPLALAYRFGERGAVEVVPWAGVTNLGVGYSSVESFMLVYRIGGGLGARFWLGDSLAINASVAAISYGLWSGIRTIKPTLWYAAPALGLSYTLLDLATINLSLASSWPIFGAGGDTVVSFGAVQSLGLRHLPLLQLQVSKTLALDFDLQMDVGLRTGHISDTFLAGVTWTF